MTKKEFIILLLLGGVIPLLCISGKLFDNTTWEGDLFIFQDVKMDIQWYIKFNVDIIEKIILYGIIFSLATYRLKIITLIFFIFSFFYIPLFWFTYMRFDFLVYLIIIIPTAWLLIKEKR